MLDFSSLDIREIEEDFYEFDFGKYFHDLVLQDNREPFGIRPSHLYPSAASAKLSNGEVIGSCLRSEWFRLNKVPKTNPPGLHAKVSAAVGEALEEFTRQQILKSNTYIASQSPVFINDIMVSGKIDIAALRHPLNKNLPSYPYIIEVKTFSGYFASKSIMGYWSGTKGNKSYTFPSPKDNHLLQAALYAYILKDQAIGTKLFYLSREDSSYKAFSVRVKEDLDKQHRIYVSCAERKYPYIENRFTIEDILLRFKELRDKFNQNIMPDREFYLKYPTDSIPTLYSQGKITKSDFDKFKKLKNKNLHNFGDWQCSYCDWKDYCWKECKN